MGKFFKTCQEGCKNFKDSLKPAKEKNAKKTENLTAQSAPATLPTKQEEKTFLPTEKKNISRSLPPTPKRHLPTFFSLTPAPGNNYSPEAAEANILDRLERCNIRF